jgi:eukaryotic-like serine/threonine-protein kinase
MNDGVAGTKPFPMESVIRAGNQDGSTVVEPTPAGVHAAAAAPLTVPLHLLIENYAAIIRAKAIYYPVAYQFLRELGRGRQGIVFLCFRQGARGCITRHAIKLFDPSIYSTPEKYWTDMGRIAVQTSRLQAVRSPNLVSRDVYEETQGIGYLQMAVVDGIDLRQFMDGAHLGKVRQRSTPEEWSRFTDVIFRLEGSKIRVQPGIAIYVMRMVLRGLEVLHARGFVHSDVKPSNIMIDRLGYVTLIDFGRAVGLNEKPAVLFGTPLYMAPEVHRRDPCLAQSDVYSTGIVGLEMLRGAPIIDPNLNDEDLYKFKLTLPARLPDLLPPHVRSNERFVHMLRRMIEPDPARRYATAEDAETGRDGLRLVHKQLALVGKDTEYGRELEEYLSKLPEHPAESMTGL